MENLCLGCHTYLHPADYSMGECPLCFCDPRSGEEPLDLDGDYALQYPKTRWDFEDFISITHDNYSDLSDKDKQKLWEQHKEDAYWETQYMQAQIEDEEDSDPLENYLFEEAHNAEEPLSPEETQALKDFWEAEMETDRKLMATLRENGADL